MRKTIPFCSLVVHADRHPRVCEQSARLEVLARAWWKEQVGFTILSYLIIQVIGVRLDAAATARASRSLTGTHNYSMTPNGKVKIPTKVPLPALQTHSLVLLYLRKFYQEDIVQRNNSRSYGIVLVCHCFSSPYPWLIIMVL